METHKPRILLCLIIGLSLSVLLALILWPRPGVECYKSPTQSGIPCYWWGE